MSTKWTIGRRQGGCAATGRPFVDGERHVSLIEIVEGELRRSDLSLEAWHERERAGGEAPLFWWMTHHRVNPSRTVQLDLESLEQLFVHLEGRAEVAVRELRYLLCLLLMRKRRLSIDKVERGPEGERMVMKRPRRDERYDVFVYDFTPERMEELRAELQAIFDGAEGPEGVRLDGDGDDFEASEGDASEAPEGAEGHEPASEGGTGDVPEDPPDPGGEPQPLV
ncbi:MAG: hypothetical protein R3F49_03265 [Planctomycetota bacterium]